MRDGVIVWEELDSGCYTKMLYSYLPKCRMGGTNETCFVLYVLPHFTQNEPCEVQFKPTV